MALSEAKKISQRNRYHRRIKEATEYLGDRCSNPDCPTPNSKLEFHHINPDEKVASVTYLAKWSKESFWGEVNKCVLLCTYCHDEFHQDEILEGERPYALYHTRPR